MVTPFQSIVAEQGFAQLLLLHGETIIYRPKTGGCYSRQAIVDRNPPEVLNAIGEVVAPRMLIRFHNDETLGVLAGRVNKGGDRIDCTLAVGDDAETAVTLDVFLLVSSGGGRTVLAVR